MALVNKILRRVFDTVKITGNPESSEPYESVPLQDYLNAAPAHMVS
jgi:hypothetical protein